MDYFYIRCSAKDQNEARQLAKAKELQIPERNIIIEKASGKNFDRPLYQAMKQLALRAGDVLYIDSLDRLGRNYDGIVAEWQELTKAMGVDIVVLDMPLLDTRQYRDLTGALISDIVLQLLSYVAESERAKNRQRQAEGIAEAKARGVYKGRKPVTIDTEQFAKLYEEVKRGERTNAYVMGKMDLKRNTYYKLIKEYESGTGRFKKQ